MCDLYNRCAFVRPVGCPDGWLLVSALLSTCWLGSARLRAAKSKAMAAGAQGCHCVQFTIATVEQQHD